MHNKLTISSLNPNSRLFALFFRYLTLNPLAFIYFSGQVWRKFGDGAGIATRFPARHWLEGEMVEGRGIRHWEEGVYLFRSEDREAAFQRALEIGEGGQSGG
ncbi:MAG: hypothetical protein ABSH24_20910, partial [Bryobacteraceae bacterium]